MIIVSEMITLFVAIAGIVGRVSAAQQPSNDYELLPGSKIVCRSSCNLFIRPYD